MIIGLSPPTRLCDNIIAVLLRTNVIVVYYVEIWTAYCMMQYTDMRTNGRYDSFWRRFFAMVGYQKIAESRMENRGTIVMSLSDGLGHKKRRGWWLVPTISWSMPKSIAGIYVGGGLVVGRKRIRSHYFWPNSKSAVFKINIDIYYYVQNMQRRSIAYFRSSINCAFIRYTKKMLTS